ncbi:MAG: phytanoyl-CoA dioxygenase family protein [Verrucomicrobiota bacterium]|nr:phytanoyl-CoA dioxygenase family protein [Verrucomicrobiota bacterium]
MSNPSSHLLRDFRKHGFVAMQSFLDPAERSELEKQLSEQVLPSLHKLPAEHVFYEDRQSRESLKQIQHLESHYKWFADWMHDRPRKLAESLLGEDVVPKNLQYFNKVPGMNQPTPPHQDGYYFMLQPPVALTMWLALDEVDVTNGCLCYVPGSHRQGLRMHAPTRTLGFSQGVMDYGDADKASEIACPAQAGDLLVHHALTIHRAAKNSHPTRQRRALGFIFYGQSAREDRQRKAAYQRQLEQRLRDQKLI